MELCTTFKRMDTNNVQSVSNNMILDRFGFKLQVININKIGYSSPPGSIALNNICNNTTIVFGCLNSHHVKNANFWPNSYGA